MKSVVLLSGGLDSVVAMVSALEDYNITFALTFDYEQKSAVHEIEASKKIAEYYSLSHKVIKLDWLGEITKTSLVAGADIPQKNFGTEDSMKNVWVPNRNGLFLNIAAAFADSYEFDYIIYGANKDEGQSFPDNTEEFRKSISKVFETSTLYKPKVIAPLINYSKGDIVKIALEKAVPLELIRSCYGSEKMHCGKCESCNHLKKALEANNCKKYINLLFGNNEN